MSNTYWAVAEAFSNRVHRVVTDIEKMDMGCFLPTFRRVRYKGGKEDSKVYPLLGGYVFFKTDDDSWGSIKQDERGRGVDGVYNILTSAGKVMRVPQEEIDRMTMEKAMRMHNTAEAAPVEPRRRRRPRRSKRARMHTASAGATA